MTLAEFRDKTGVLQQAALTPEDRFRLRTALKNVAVYRVVTDVEHAVITDLVTHYLKESSDAD